MCDVTLLFIISNILLKIVTSQALNIGLLILIHFA